ncbi:hypothetical protein G7068_05910 [Leucobacter viscericola]|uniref:Uncharacterized protein n=1 Tax=Leucobacter viscericola TaxID=2714935 RepID=A0A6G7XE47_9MICO|nr:hypothetical protein [Leucobacter viscericola]QIK62782.1 hypothetical protein G7068_05910 [Leucobacter viscericola]
MTENPEGNLRLALSSTEILPATILTVSVVLFLTVSLMLLLRRPAQ